MDSFPNLYRICYNIASILCFGFLASRHVGPTSPTRDWTQASCIRWQSLNHWTSREVPAITSFPSLCFTLDHQQQNPGTKPGIQSPRSRSTQPFPTSLPTHPPHPPATATQSISLFLINKDPPQQGPSHWLLPVPGVLAPGFSDSLLSIR